MEQWLSGFTPDCQAFSTAKIKFTLASRWVVAANTLCLDGNGKSKRLIFDVLLKAFHIYFIVRCFCHGGALASKA
jgi:hypothetical protein